MCTVEAKTFERNITAMTVAQHSETNGRESINCLVFRNVFFKLILTECGFGFMKKYLLINSYPV